MSFAVVDFITKDSELIHDPNVHFVFLIRHPHPTVISFYKRFASIPGTWPDTFRNFIGYEAEYKLFQIVKENAVNKPIILLTEDLCDQPKQTIHSLCKRLEIPYIPHSLEWKNLGESFTWSLD